MQLFTKFGGSWTSTSFGVTFRQAALKTMFCYCIDEEITTVLPAKSDSDDMLCLQSYQGLMIDRSLVY